MTRHRRASPLQLAAGFTLAGWHAGITLWHRWPMLASAWTSDPRAADSQELMRMVTEKSAAVVEGTLNAHKEAMRIAGAAMTGKLEVQDMAAAPASIAAAGLRPAFRRVKANSKRLSRRS